MDESKKLQELVEQNQANFGVDPDLAKSLEDLNEALKASELKTPTQGVALQVNDLSLLADKYLSASARFDSQNKAKTLIVKYDDGRSYEAIYFSAVVKTGNEENGVERIAKVLNNLSAKGLIHSMLAPVSSLELARTSSVAKSVVFAFPLVPSNCVKDCQAIYADLFTLEGGVGPEIEDLSVPLAEGEFLAQIRISAYSHMFDGQAIDKASMLEKQIQQYLKYLPEGTEVVKKTELAVTDLSYPVEVIFRHPQMHDVSKVDINYVRCVRRVGDDKIEQYNRFIGLQYFDKNGKEMYL